MSTNVSGRRWILLSVGVYILLIIPVILMQKIEDPSSDAQGIMWAIILTCSIPLGASMALVIDGLRTGAPATAIVFLILAAVVAVLLIVIALMARNPVIVGYVTVEPF